MGVNTYIPMPQAILDYINVNKQLKANIILPPDTVIFTGASILQPTMVLNPTSIDQFEFFVNGENIPSSLAVFNSYTGGVSVTFNTNLLKFELEAGDEIIAIGKFA
jgi:hypothetical protein